jgi:peptidoglycan/xylan/chitin deacetylase (PgdA/CDA1 family)
MLHFSAMGSKWVNAASTCFVLGILIFALNARVPYAGSSLEDADSSAEESSAYIAAAARAISSNHTVYSVSSTTPQFVVLSFDGSKSIDMLNETLTFEKKMAAEKKQVRFTYFINGAYFLTSRNADLYEPPNQQRGVSNIGFSNNGADIVERVATFNTAVSLGNEVASHSAGHFNGVSWSYDDWKKEFAQFDSLIRNVKQNNALFPVADPTFTSMVGFRAPLLGFNQNLFAVESDDHFLYDASGVGLASEWPYKDERGLWHIPLGTIFLGPERSPAVAMDYSLWIHQSQGINNVKRGTKQWDAEYNEIEEAYMRYFNSNYGGDRAPVVIGDHFTKWNDGLYWEAMKVFASNVCGLPNVRCTTFKELVAYLNANGTPIAQK